MKKILGPPGTGKPVFSKVHVQAKASFSLRPEDGGSIDQVNHEDQCANNTLEPSIPDWRDLVQGGCERTTGEQKKAASAIEAEW